MVIKKIIVFVAFLVSASCYAVVPSNAAVQQYEAIKTHITQQQHNNNSASLKRTVNNLFHWLNSLANPNNTVTRSAVKKYFTADTVIYKNGKVVASGREAVYHGLKLFQKHIKNHKIKMARIILPFKQIIVRGNKVTLHYTAVAQKAGHPAKTIHTLTTLKMQDGKVQKWWQTHSQTKHHAQS